VLRELIICTIELASLQKGDYLGKLTLKLNSPTGKALRLLVFPGPI